MPRSFPSAPARERKRVVKTRKDTEQDKQQQRYRARKELLKQQKIDFLTILKRNMGLITPACQTMQIGYREVHTWMAGDLEFRERVDEVLQGQCDFVEQKLLLKIKGTTDNPDGDTKAICFYLLHKGHRNGYQAQAYGLRGAAASLFAPQLPAPQSDDPEATEAAQDRSEMDDDALMAAIRIAESREPGVIARRGKRASQTIMEADLVVPKVKK